MTALAEVRSSAGRSLQELDAIESPRDRLGHTLDNAISTLDLLNLQIKNITSSSSLTCLSIFQLPAKRSAAALERIFPAVIPKIT